jgi:maleylpyruvate isomerase
VARRGDTFPARVILSRRLSEVEIHHVDLDAGYRPADWPASFVAATLVRVAGDFAGRADAPACLARPVGLDAVFPIGPAGPQSASTGSASTGQGSTGQGSQVTVSGPPAALLAWLIGRDTGIGLEVAGADAVPVLPPWR